MQVLLLALPLLALPRAASQSVKSCGGPSDHLKNPVVKLTPDPPSKGGTLIIQASGTLDEAETGFNASLDLQVTALRMIHASVQGSLPLSVSPGLVAGPFSMTIGPITIPKDSGSAVTKGQVHVVNSKSEPIMCIDIDLTVPDIATEEAAPFGSYCGSVEGLVDVKLSISGQSRFTVNATLGGEMVVCKDEEYKLDASTGAISLPGLQDPSDCIAKKLEDFGEAPGDLSMSYDAAANSIHASLAGQDVVLTPAACPAEAAPLPAVTSCGKATDHIPDFKLAAAGGVTTMTGTLDEAVTKATVDLDLSLKVFFVTVPLKVKLPLAIAPGMSRGTVKATFGPSTILVSPDPAAELKGTIKVNDGKDQEVMCLNVDKKVANDELLVV